ncbi:MAG: hypothetical protein KDB33_03205 [Acidimicrobiales bacterium]|nr:hypothetical protein [Acidimicrobiales bacterium]
MRRGRVVRVSVVAVVVVAAAVLGIGAPASAAVTLSATPSTNLIDGQSVQVTMTGLPANFTSAGIIQCVGVPASNTCDSSSLMWAAADGDGNASQSYTVSAMLSTSAHGVVDCRTPPLGLDCVIAGGTGIDNLGVQVVTFDPVGPLRPPPTLVATPSTNLVNDQLVGVTGSGYTVGTSVYVLQCDTATSTLCRGASIQPIVVAGDQSIAGSVQVRAQYVVGNTLVDCQAAPGACELRVPGVAPHLAGVAEISFDPLAPPTPMPTMTVTPDTGLVDLQTVSVTGASFPTTWTPSPGSGVPPVMISQCLTAAPYSCQTAGMAVPDPTGAFTVSIDVRAALYSYSDDMIHDCRVAPNTCRLVGTSYGDYDVAAFTPLAFDPSAPLAPPPSLVATPSTGLLDGQIIDVTGSNFIGESYGPGTPIAVPDEGADQPLRWNERLGGFTPDLAAMGAVGDVGPEKLATPGYTTVVQCVTGEPSWTGCDYGTAAGMAFDAGGNLAGRVQVHAVLTLIDDGGNVSTADCRSTACELRAGTLGNPLLEAIEPIAFDPGAPLAPPPTISVDPALDLVDGQQVTVRGEHFWWFETGSSTTLVECGATPPDLSGFCPSSLTLGGAPVAEDGSFVTTVRVANGLGGVGGIDCRTAVGACRVVAFTYGPGIEPPAADLGFDPNAPLLPLPEAAVSPSTNLAVGQQVTVSGRWFTSADTVEIVQCADRWLLTPVACDDATAVTTTTDDLGRAAATFTLQRSLTLRDGTAVDCTVEDCAVLVRNPDVFGEVAWVPIGMLAPTASGPTAPPPAVVSPNFAG